MNQKQKEKDDTITLYAVGDVVVARKAGLSTQYAWDGDEVVVNIEA